MHTQRVALVTGCSDPNGLGAAMCKRLLQEKYTVIATGRDVERTIFLEKEGCVVLQLDIGDTNSVQAVLKEVEGVYGRLDMLINNAAIVYASPLLDMDHEAFRAQFEVNLFGTFTMIQSFGPLLVRTANTAINTSWTGSAGKGGGGVSTVAGRPPNQRTVMVNIGSVQASVGLPWQGAYGASKAAIQTMTDTLRKEMSSLGVDVINVECCAVKTPQRIGRKPPIDAVSNRPTGFYNRYIPLQPKLSATMAKNASSGHSPDRAAHDIISAATQLQPPLKIWPGGSGWMFKYFFGLLPVWVFEGILKRETLVYEITEWVPEDDE